MEGLTIKTHPNDDNKTGCNAIECLLSNSAIVRGADHLIFMCFVLVFFLNLDSDISCVPPPSNTTERDDP